ncbi:type VI secretion system baseplate subunit TssG [Thaumasiovibrio sp. DFM-14]|uniref:type VI secretion system baseplate subunit TssG n=1 Tax=Thaumasiovibrio sp. DFM-14 TaxID=3384792 RepID=UPI0039A1CFEB
MMDDVFENSHEFSFFQAVHLLEKQYKSDVSSQFDLVGESDHVKDERILFRISPELGFPRSDIRDIREFEREGKRVTEVEVNFSGLHGTGSPLPTSYTEKLAGRGEDDNPVRDFLDFFHNRYLSMFYRIWRKNRYQVTYESGATDRMSSILYNLVGLSSEGEVRDHLHLDWAKLLSYLGQLSARTRSADLVGGIVKHCFNLSDVAVEEWVRREIDIPLSQQTRLGVINHQLGELSHLGNRMVDITGKFNLVIKGINYQQYKLFLDGAEGNRELKELMKFVLIDPLAWDLKLIISSAELPRNSLGEGEGNSLGQTFWLGELTGSNEEIIMSGEI